MVSHDNCENRIEPDSQRDALINSRAILDRKFTKLEKRVQAAKAISNPKTRRIEQIECQLEMDKLRETERCLSGMEVR